jgi:hypothetical protein
VQSYGCGPGEHIKYQPDVVVVRGGAGAIRSVTSDGLVWTIDRSAPGASGLQVGKVMFVTSRAVGRVVEIRDQGSSRVATLAPVDLTDVVSDATINIDQDFDLAKMVYQDVPNLPGAVSEPLPARAATLSLLPGAMATVDPSTVVLLSAPYIPPLPPPAPVPKAISVGKWSATPYSAATKLGLKIAYAGQRGLKLEINLAFLVDHFHVRSGTTIADGRTVSSGFLIEGLKGIQVSLAGGVANGSVDNEKVSLEVPVEVNLPIPPTPYTAELPLNLKATYKFVIETAFSGKDSTLFASGKYGLAGPLGIWEGVPTAPSFSVEQSLIDSIGGLPIGPSGIVFAMKLKVLLGIGTAATSAGVYGILDTSLGLTNGSALGAPLARCRGATLDIKVGGGVGLDIPAPVAAALKALLPTSFKVEKKSVETSTTIVHRSQVIPDVPLCTA